MNLSEFNNLTDLFFYQAEKQDSKSIFLEWLNPKNKKIFTWSETSANIICISNKCIKQEYQRLFLKMSPVFPVLRTS